MRKNKLILFVASSLSACALAVCAGCASSRPSRFFVLPMPPEMSTDDEVNLSDPRYRVGILPVELSAYLDRPQIVTRISEEEISVDEFNRWAAPLADGIAEAMSRRMLTKLPDTDIDIRPWPDSKRFDYQVDVAIGRLDGTPGISSRLDAEWTVIRGRNADDIVAKQISRYEAEMTDKSCAALLRSMSSLVTMLSDDISDAIKGDMLAGDPAAE